MENNENLNNQMKENKVQEEKKNNNKTISIVVLIIGLLLVGFAGYKIFIEKPDESKENDKTAIIHVTQDNSQTEEVGINVNDKLTYILLYNKYVFNIVSINDQEIELEVNPALAYVKDGYGLTTNNRFILKRDEKLILQTPSSDVVENITFEY